MSEFLSKYFAVNISPLSKVKGKKPYDRKMVFIVSKVKKKKKYTNDSVTCSRPLTIQRKQR